MAEFDPQETVIVKFDGGTYKVRKHLTIGEEIARKGRRSQICAGQYGNMVVSPDLDERTVAFLSDIITELDARIVEGPDSWKGAESSTDDNKLMELWKEMTAALGRRFPPDRRGVQEETGGSKGDSESEPEDGVGEEMVSREIQAEPS